MSEEETFLSRWSRLKRENPDKKADFPPTNPAPSSQDEALAAREERPSCPSPSPRGEETCDPFDLASLPSIESIASDTDITAFLRAGVPAELTRAALRRVWVADPAIRNFVGIAENQWDFTKPDTIHGFGPLRATDDVPSLVAQALGKSEVPPPAAAPADPELKTTQDCPPVDGPPAPSEARQSGAPDQERNEAIVPNIKAVRAERPESMVNPPEDQSIVALARRHGKALPE